MSGTGYRWEPTTTEVVAMSRPDYRKHKGSGYYEWHFCTSCPNWPIHAYDSQSTAGALTLCDHCQQLERDGQCT